MEDSLAKLEKEMRAMTRRTEAGVERCHVCGDETLGRSIILTFDALASRLSRLRERLEEEANLLLEPGPFDNEEAMDCGHNHDKFSERLRAIAGDET